MKRWQVAVLAVAILVLVISGFVYFVKPTLRSPQVGAFYYVV